MENENELNNAPAPAEDAPSAAPSGTAGCLTLLGVMFVVGIIMIALMAVNASSHPYSGTGIIKSHTPWGSAMCNITVNESKGGEHTYQRTGGLPYCAGVNDGSTVVIDSGVIKSITP